MAGIGGVAALIYLRIYEKRNPAYGADRDLAVIYGLVGAIVGAKLMYLAINAKALIGGLPYLFSDTSAFVGKYLSGGFVFFGGLYGFLLAAWIYIAASKAPKNEVWRGLIPCIPLFHGFGRIGCFLTGCCYGKVTDSWFGVCYQRAEIAPNGVPLIPVQLVEAGLEFALFVALVYGIRKGRDYRWLLGIYMFWYGVGRFFLEFWRGDMYRGFIGALSISQIIAILTAVFGGVLVAKKEEKRKHTANR